MSYLRSALARARVVGPFLASPGGQLTLCLAWLLLTFGGHTRPALAWASLLLWLGLFRFLSLVVWGVRSLIVAVKLRQANAAEYDWEKEPA